MNSFDDIIDSLLLSYNTSILNETRISLRESLYEEAKKCLESSDTCNNRKTLMRLINNHRLANKPIADFIKGPVSITLHWNPSMKLLIYIFGEFHTSETDCPPENVSMFIEDYMKQLLTNSDSYIDFFLEEKAHFGYNPDLTDSTGNTRLDILANRFRECISDVKSRNTNPNCNISRSHFFDIRQGVVDSHFDVVSNLIGALGTLEKSDEENIETFIIKFNSIFSSSDFFPFIRKIKDTSSDTEFVALFAKELFDHPFLKKKMDRSTISTLIYSFIMNEIKLESLKFKNTIQENLTKLFKILTKIDVTLDKKGQPIKIIISPTNIDRLIRYIKRFRIGLILVNSAIADGYLLSRIFKEFNINTDILEKKRGFDEPERPHNIIIYGGESHANRCRKFLENYMKSKRLEQNTFEDLIHFSNCIDMTGITQPLFSYIPNDKSEYYKEPYKPIYTHPEIIQ
jgi:hypothetical protein